VIISPNDLMKIITKSNDSDDRLNSSIRFLNRRNSACLRITGYTAFALIAFAANSVLCRLALGKAAIDAASFTTIRLVSGALVLLLVGTAAKTDRAADRGNWTSAFMLFLYAVAFSFAYISLNTGTGALILFVSVQATMIIFAIWKGERLGLMSILGLLIALAGLTYLVFPGLAAPSPSGAALMALAGISWGIYSLRGRGSVSDLFSESAYYFCRCILCRPFRGTGIGDRLRHLVCRPAVPFSNQCGLSAAARTRSGCAGGPGAALRTAHGASAGLICHDYRGRCPGSDSAGEI
jgi:hypothetical protein